MAKPPEIGPHDGKCGFCKSDVRLDATVCSSCGARWGTSTGDTPEMVYQAGHAKMKIGLLACVVLAVFFLISIYLESGWTILAMLLGFFLGPPALGFAIGGLISMRRSKRLLVNWWREA